MRHRAKCKVCGSVIESKGVGDYVVCECGDVVLEGDPSGCFLARLKNKSSMVIIDDEGNEIIPKQAVEAIPMPDEKPSRRELLESLEHWLENLENLPVNARMTPVTHADLASVVSLVCALFRLD